MAHSLRRCRDQIAIFDTLRQLLPRQAPRLIKQAFAHRNQDRYLTVLNRLVEHVNRHHFPIYDLDLDYLAECFPQLPIQCTNYDHESDFEGTGLATCIAATLSGFYSQAPEWTTIQERLGPTIPLPHCFTTPTHQCEIDFEYFAALCAKHPRPVKHFPTLLKILAHETGCLFLDVSYDWDGMQDHYTWNPDDIATLTAQWNTGKQLHRLWLQTDRQFTAQPAQWRTVFHCWEEMCRHASAPPQINSGTPLVDVLAPTTEPGTESEHRESIRATPS